MPYNLKHFLSIFNFQPYLLFYWPTTYFKIDIVLDAEGRYHRDQNWQKNQFQGYVPVGCSLVYSDCEMHEKWYENEIR